MNLAYATKDQMKVWKSTSKPDKDYPERSTERVMFEIQSDERCYIAATDGYQFVKRYIQSEEGASSEKQLKTSIPRSTMEKAEKVMKPRDRAYFSSGKISVYEVTTDEKTQEELEQLAGTFPYAEQLDMFIDFEPALSKATAHAPELAKVVTLDARVLKKVVEQMKSGDSIVHLNIRFAGEMDAVTITAFDGIEEEEIRAAVMPIKSS